MTRPLTAAPPGPAGHLGAPKTHAHATTQTDTPTPSDTPTPTTATRSAKQAPRVHGADAAKRGREVPVKDRLGSVPPGAKRTNPERVTAAVRRAVFERDGEQCTFTDATGRRCEERGWLQLDHALPLGRGGDSSVDNVRVLCRTHNLLAAERVFGREHVARRSQRHLDQPK